MAESTFALQKNDLDGNLIWLKKYQVADARTIHTLSVEVLDDGYILQGEADWFPVVLNVVDGYRQFIAKTDKNGEILWVKWFWKNNSSSGTNINNHTAVSDKAFWLIGSRRYFSDLDISLLKMDGDGNAGENCFLFRSISVTVSANSNAQSFDLPVYQYGSSTQLAANNLKVADADLRERAFCTACGTAPCTPVLLSETVFFCPGDSVFFAGNLYGQPTVVYDTLFASTPEGCDSIYAYHLEWLPQPTKTETVAFCPGASVSIGGTTYTQPGTVQAVLPSATDCDTLATYHLEWLPQPTKTETVAFCPGASVSIGGTTYTQPGTVQVVLPSATGCDTLATYHLQYVPLPQSSGLLAQCPADMTVTIAAGLNSAPVFYGSGSATTNCPCGGAEIHLSSGLTSGAPFPVGVTQICLTASDSCQMQNSCCFTVRVENETTSEDPCDVKNTPCLKFEILRIFQNPAKQKTYRMRVTNTCAGELAYLFFQLPDGLTADAPAHGSVYAAPGGKTYAVRNPNFSPFYSIRYKTAGAGLTTGQSDIFEYTLPPQAQPDHIHAAAKLTTGQYFETHLNVFGCEIEQIQSRSSEALPDAPGGQAKQRATLHLFPNPANETLYADLSAWTGQPLHLFVTDALGRVRLERKTSGERPLLELELPPHWSAGLYHLTVIPATGVPHTARFVRQ